MMNDDNVSSKLLWNHHMTQLSVLAQGKKPRQLVPGDKFADVSFFLLLFSSSFLCDPKRLGNQSQATNLLDVSFYKIWPLTSSPLIHLFEANARCQQRIMANVPMSHFRGGGAAFPTPSFQANVRPCWASISTCKSVQLLQQRKSSNFLDNFFVS